MSKSKIIALEEYLQENNITLNRNEITLEIEQIVGGVRTPFNEHTLYCKLEKEGYPVSLNHITAYVMSDLISTNNPFEDYFNRIGDLYDPNTKIDLIDSLASYVKSNNQERFNQSFKKMLVRTIACALDDKVFNKHIFVLVQPEQNSGKSTFLRWLMPPGLERYYQENIEINKDGEIALSENFIINFDELASLLKGQITAIKSILSRIFVKVRPPYLKKAVRVPRRASFVGSTNQTTFLNDPTGSVRWICHQINRIDWNYKKDFNIDEIWSQAYYLYRTGFDFQLTSTEIKENEISNEEFQIETPEIEIIRKHFYEGTKEDHHLFLTATDIKVVIKKHYDSISYITEGGIGRALSVLRFRRSSKYKKGCRLSLKGYFIKLRDEDKLEGIKLLLK